jgi:hypothetical protein
VTAAAIAGVLVAGTAALAANIGILDAADDSVIGELAATDELLPVADVDAPGVAGLDPSTTTVAPTTTTVEPATAVAQQYDIADTGTVWVLATRSGVALDHVVAETGWTPVLTQSELRSLRVDFINGDRTIVFTATVGIDGVVVVDVTEPSTVVAPAPTVPTPSTPSTAPTSGSTTSAYSEDHDDDHEDDDHEEHDDDQEYEGADDDD